MPPSLPRAPPHARPCCWVAVCGAAGPWAGPCFFQPWEEIPAAATLILWHCRAAKELQKIKLQNSSTLVKAAGCQHHTRFWLSGAALHPSRSQGQPAAVTFRISTPGEDASNENLIPPHFIASAGLILQHAGPKPTTPGHVSHLTASL